MIFHRAREEDLPELLRIEDECFGKERFSVEVVRAFIVRGDAFTMTAYDDKIGRMVGSATCLISEESGEGRIASVSVVKDHRGQSVGSGLLDECEKVLRSFRLRKYVLEVETSNMPAILLYTNRGYKILGVLKDYYGTGRDAYAMEKKVTRASRRLIVRKGSP